MRSLNLCEPDCAVSLRSAMIRVDLPACSDMGLCRLFGNVTMRHFETGPREDARA